MSSFEFLLPRGLPLENDQGSEVQPTPRADPTPSQGNAVAGPDQDRPHAAATGGMGTDTGGGNVGAVNDWGLYPQIQMEVQGFVEGVMSINGGQPVSGAVEIATAWANVFYVTLNGNAVITPDGMPKVPVAQGGDRNRSGAVLIVIQPNGYQVTWGAPVCWQDGQFDPQTEGNGYLVVCLQPLFGPGLPGVFLGYVCGDNHQPPQAAAASS